MLLSKSLLRRSLASSRARLRSPGRRDRGLYARLRHSRRLLLLAGRPSVGALLVELDRLQLWPHVSRRLLLLHAG